MQKAESPKRERTVTEREASEKMAHNCASCGCGEAPWSKTFKGTEYHLCRACKDVPFSKKMQNTTYMYGISLLECLPPRHECQVCGKKGKFVTTNDQEQLVIDHYHPEGMTTKKFRKKKPNFKAQFFRGCVCRRCNDGLENLKPLQLLELAARERELYDNGRNEPGSEAHTDAAVGMMGLFIYSVARMDIRLYHS